MKTSSKIIDFFQMRKAYRQLSQLSDASLKDIGLSRGDIRRAVYGR
ncbi:DUF1127 domain-containing protein [Rhizobium vallis]|uniref:DUF1127 domain-containing protein n=1 Tax=Rhizobium vallis TaxID=634290 RepID=A0A432PDE5_9HYPH|nr:DUF1127 domain-containing protein [Rhizobium vallis]RUM20486.1 DUF1127 domain-containing protein [Rhizobium vallis]